MGTARVDGLEIRAVDAANRVTRVADDSSVRVMFINKWNAQEDRSRYDCCENLIKASVKTEDGGVI